MYDLLQKRDLALAKYQAVVANNAGNCAGRDRAQTDERGLSRKLDRRNICGERVSQGRFDFNRPDAGRISLDAGEPALLGSGGSEIYVLQLLWQSHSG